MTAILPMSYLSIDSMAVFKLSSGLMLYIGVLISFCTGSCVESTGRVSLSLLILAQPLFSMSNLVIMPMGLSSLITGRPVKSSSTILSQTLVMGSSGLAVTTLVLIISLICLFG